MWVESRELTTARDGVTVPLSLQAEVSLVADWSAGCNRRYEPLGPIPADLTTTCRDIPLVVPD